jgi:ribosomal protein L16 Arg81 hydroxylase
MRNLDHLFGARAIGKLISPISVDDFLAEYWQRKVLVVNRTDRHYFDDLLTVNDIDELLGTTPIPASQVEVVRSASGVPKAAYAGGTYIEPYEVLRLHREGHTLILRAMHLWLHRLRGLCAEAEAFFHCNAQANLYLTPTGHRSSSAHWDAHDIFVIQIAGTKRWVLHESSLKKPLYTYRFDRERHPIGPEVGEFTLNAGDVAYVPRGVAHNPVALDYSVHMALGVLVRTWADVLARMFESLTQDTPELRDILPVRHGQHAFDIEECSARFSDIASKLVDLDRMRSTLASMSEAFVRSRPTDTRRMLVDFARGAAVGLGSTVELPPNGPAVVEGNGESCRVVLNGMELNVSSSLMPALEFIKDRRRILVADIPLDSEDQRVALAEYLLEQGCLRVAREGPER